jgi:hypothetical protein
MSTFSLTNTGSEIDSAIGKVHGADTTPTSGSTDMVTSGGVYTAINNLSLANLAGSALVTESEGIVSNDNDTTIPTSAAVKDFVDNNAAVQTRVVVPPTSFYLDSDAFMDTTYGKAFSSSSSGSMAVFSYDIPEGYKATSLQFYGSMISATVYSNVLNSSSVGTVIGTASLTQGSGVHTGTVDFTDTTSTTTRFITLKISRGQSSPGTCYGARIFISKI